MMNKILLSKTTVLVLLFFMPAGVIMAQNLCPDENHPHVIDLGIGVKWSCCNLGAATPWEGGDTFSWGETETKQYHYHTWDNYIFKDNSWRNLGADISGTQYDAAHVQWGGDWCMPNEEQYRLLDEKCDAEWVTVDDVTGVKFTGPNGNSVFFPTTWSNYPYEGTHCYFTHG